MQPANLSKTIISLMKGIVFKQQQPLLWQDMQQLEANIIDYVAIIGLQLIIDDNEGYAYLHQITESNDGVEIPKLIAQRPLSFIVSLLCVLLRKKLIEADSSGNLDKIIVNKEEIIRMMQNFLPEKNNQAKTQEQIGSAIKKVIEIGFLQKIKNEMDHFEILRIIKAFVDAQWLIDVDKKLELYLAHGK